MIAVRGVASEIQQLDISDAEKIKLFEDAAIADAVNDAVNGFEGGRTHLMGALMEAGFDADAAKSIFDEIVQGEEAEQFEDDSDVPFTVGEEEKNKPLKSDKKDSVTVGRMEFSKDEKGRSVATVRERGDKYGVGLKSNTKSVRFENERYKPDKRDRVLAMPFLWRRAHITGSARIWLVVLTLTSLKR